MTEQTLKDADIREPLFDYLEEYYGKVRFLEEKVTGRARADIVMVLPGRVARLGLLLGVQGTAYQHFVDRSNAVYILFEIGIGNVLAIDFAHVILG